MRPAFCLRRCRNPASFDAMRNSSRWCGKSRQSDSIAACAALESDMAHIFGFERSQLLLLPESVDDYVGADNPVRFIDAFVDPLDLAVVPDSSNKTSSSFDA